MILAVPHLQSLLNSEEPGRADLGVGEGIHDMWKTDISRAARRGAALGVSGALASGALLAGVGGGVAAAQAAGEVHNISLSAQVYNSAPRDVAFVGDELVYRTTITNNGTAPVTGVSLSDTSGSDTFCDDGNTLPLTLAPGASANCTVKRVVTGEEFADSDSISNTITVSSDQTDDAEAVVDFAKTTEAGQHTYVTMQNLDDPQGEQSRTHRWSVAGQRVAWNYYISNTGAVPLTGVEALHNIGTGSPEMTCDSNGPIPVGGERKCTLTATAPNWLIFDFLPSWTNEARIKTDQTGTQNVYPDRDAVHAVVNSVVSGAGNGGGVGLTNEKYDRSTAYASLGETLEFEARISGVPNSPLRNARIQSSNLDLECPPMPFNGTGTEVLVCTGTHVVTQDDVDAGEFNAKISGNLDGAMLTLGVDNNVRIAKPPTPAPAALGVATKITNAAGEGASIRVGTTLEYETTVTNTGQMGLNGISITDSAAGNLTCTPTSDALAAGASKTCTGSHIVTADDITDENFSSVTTAASNQIPQVQSVSSIAAPAAPGYEMVTGVQGSTLTNPQTGDDYLPEGTTWEITGGGQPGMTIDPATGAITWDTEVTTPVNSYEVEVTFTYPNGRTETVTATFVVTDMAADAAPGYGTATGVQGSRLVNPQTGTNIPVGSTFAIVGGGQDGMTINPGTGVVTWNTSVTTAVDTYQATVQVTYPNGRTSTVTATFVVTDIAADAAPGYGDVSVQQGQTATSPQTGTNIPDGSTFAIVGGGQDGMTINPDTGEVVWDTDITTPPGAYEVDVEVTYPNGRTSTVTATITVTEINYEAPSWGTVQGMQGQRLDNPASMELPSGSVSELIGEVPEGVTVDPATGEVTWATTTDTPVGTHEVEVQVTYPNGSVRTGVATFIVDEIVYVGDPGYELVTVEAGKTGTSPQLGIELPEGTTYELGEGSQPGMTINPDTGEITWETTDETEAGAYEVEVVVTYPNGQTETVIAEFEVTLPPTTPPTTPPTKPTTPTTPKPTKPTTTPTSPTTPTTTPTTPTKTTSPTKPTSPTNAQVTPLPSHSTEPTPVGVPDNKVGPVVDTGGAVATSWWSKIVNAFH